MTQLALRIGVIGADTAVQALATVRQALAQVQQASITSIQSFSEFGEAIGRVGIATIAFRQAFGRLSGIGIASDIEALRIQLEILTGSQQRARQLADTLIDLASATRFNTAEVAQFGSMLLASGTSVEQLSTELSSLLDLISAMGVRREDMQRVLENFVNIRGLEAGTSSMMDIRQMFRAMPGIGTALGLALGREPVTPAEANELLKQMGGEEFFALLIRAAERFEGASVKLTIADAISNFNEQVQFILIPTGEMLGNMFRTLSPVLGTGVRFLQAFNRALYGVPGALFALAVAAGAASASLRVMSAAGITAGIAQLFSVIRLFGGLVARLPIILLLAIRQLGAGGLFRMGIVGLIVSGVSQLLGELFESFGLRGSREAFGTIGGAAGIGATIGGILGSVIPGIGTALGILIGGILGALVGSIRLLLGGGGETEQQADAAQQTAQNTARMARALEDIRVQVIGGGQRTRLAATRYEVEAYLRRLAVSGI